MTGSRLLLRIGPVPALLLAAGPLLAGSVSGRIFDWQGKPIPGARVAWTRALSEEETLLAQTEGREAEVVGETRSDADGTFRAVLEKPGVSISLRIQPAGLPEVRLPGPYESDETVTLEDLRFPTAAKVRGRVVDSKGKAVAGARVSAMLFGDPGTDAVFRGDARSDEKGAFEVAAAPEGDRSLGVRAAGFVPYSRYSFRSAAAETVVLRAGGAVRGSVLDPPGRPAAGAIVVCDEVAGRADETGAFLLAGVPAGTRSVGARWKDDFAARREVRVAVGSEIETSLRLSKAAAITGTVVDETTRRPVAGARISVRESGGDERLAGRRVRADARGRFRAAGLPPGRYSVDAAAEGYLPVEVPRVVAAAPAGQPLAIALRRDASLSGHVVDETGKPVSGARVALAREGGFRRIARTMRRASFRSSEAVTRDDGSFTLRRLVPGSNMTVEASKADFAPARKTGLRLKEGETLRSVTLVLRAGLAVRGSVVDPEGRPVAGAEIQAERSQSGGARRMMFFRAGAEGEKPDAVSAADGRFLLTGLEAGRYQVSASLEGFVQKAPATADVAEGKENRLAPIVLEAGVAIAGLVRGGNGESVPGARVFAIVEAGRPLDTETGPAGEFRIAGLAAGKAVRFFVSAEGYAQRQSSATPPADDVVITLETNGSVRGRVEDAARQAPVTDFSISRGEAPPGGGMVMRLYTGDEGRSFHSEDGSFELSNVPPGRWTIKAEAAGYRSAEVSGVEVGPGETKDGIVLSLKRGGSLSGRVLDAPRGTPVANASVGWSLAGAGTTGPMYISSGGSQRETAADADGRFAFDGLPEGKLTLTASHPDYLDASLEVDPDRQGTVEISLGTGGAISGAVVGSDGRSPASGARVTLEAMGEAIGGRFGGDSATAGGDGSFVFEHLRAGKYQLVAQGNAGTSAPKEVVLTEGQRMDGVLLQTAGGTLLRGTVAGLPAAELAGVRVFASGSSYFDSTATDAEGLFTLRDVPAGVVRVNASTSFLQGRSTQKTVEIPEGAGEFPIEITFEGAARLSGQVTRGAKPLPGLFVSANPDPPTGAARASGQTDENGRYALEGLSDGAYRLSVMGQSVSITRSVAVSGDTEEDVALPASVLSGVVTDESSGEPIEGADVQAETGSEVQSFAVKRSATDSNGAYSIADVEPGTYKVTARRPGYRLKTQSVTVGSDPASLDFDLVKGSGLSVRVADGQTGIPLSSVQVLAFGAGGTVAFQGRVALDGSGSGEVPSLSDGAYAVYVFSDGYAPRSLPAVSVPSPPLSLGLTPGGRVHARSESFVTGRLTDASGAVVLLTAFRLDGALTVAPPVTVWEHLPPGSYRFVPAGVPGGKAYAFNVAEGQTTELLLD